MLDVRLFGKFIVSLDGQAVEIPSRSMQSLLAYLILNVGTAYRREQLAGLLWPDSDEVNARHNLRQTLWRLGKAVGKQYFLTDKVSVGFNPQADYRLDVAILQDEVTEPGSIDQLMRSVSVYTDVLLPGFYQDWVFLERQHLQAIYEDRMQMLLDRLVQEGRWRETREWAERWIAQGQVPEPAYRALMTAQAGLGDQAGVTAVYQRLVKALEEEIGVEASPETQALFQRISSGQDLPELQKTDTKLHPKVRLPLQPTPFFGREEELAEVAQRLADPTCRLFTLVGPGGMGKTRLALQAAFESSDLFADGVCFVRLAPISSHKFLLAAIAEALNLSFQGAAEPEAQVMNYLQNKECLLLLDNFEHILDGAILLSKIVMTAPGVKLLVTSRERLNLQEEWVYELQGMTFPKLSPQHFPSKESGVHESRREGVEAYSAVQLFEQRALQAQTTFDLATEYPSVVRICQLVEGMPLGLELAASWINLMSCQEIAVEIEQNLDFLTTSLRNLPERHRSLRAVFQHSWQLLSDEEKEVFKKLSVFRGGFTRPAAESISEATHHTLMALVNKSLIQPDYNSRYHIHELLRQFGAEKLAEAGGVEQIRDHHLAFFLKLAEEAEPQFAGSDLATWLKRLEIEHDNLRVALDWSLTTKDMAELSLRLSGSLAVFWYWHGYFSEGREYLSAALSRPEASQQTAARAKALYGAGRLAFEQGDFLAVRALLEESLDLNRKLSTTDQLGLAHTLRVLGITETEEGNYVTAASLLKEALDIMEELKDQSGIARTLGHLGWCAMRPGDYEQACQYFDEALSLYRQIGDKDGLSMVLSGLGELAVRQGDSGRAIMLLEESLALRRETGYKWGIAASLGTLGWALLRQGDLKQSLTHLGESLTLRREIGDSSGGMAWCLEKIAEIVMTNGQRQASPQRDEAFQRAVQLFGAAEALREPIGSAIDLVDQPEYERKLAIVRTQLGEAAFAVAWAEGQAMTLKQAIEYALAVDPDQLA